MDVCKYNPNKGCTYHTYPVELFNIFHTKLNHLFVHFPVRGTRPSHIASAIELEHLNRPVDVRVLIPSAAPTW